MIEERAAGVVPPVEAWLPSRTLWPPANSSPVVSASVSDVCAGMQSTPVLARSAAALVVTAPVVVPVATPVVVAPGAVAPVVVVGVDVVPVGGAAAVVTTRADYPRHSRRTPESFSGS